MDHKAFLPRRSVQFFGQELSWPHDRAFYGFLALFALFVVPQLVVNLIQLNRFSVSFRGHGFRVAGPLAMMPFVLLFALSLHVVRAGAKPAVDLSVDGVCAVRCGDAGQRSGWHRHAGADAWAVSAFVGAARRATRRAAACCDGISAPSCPNRFASCGATKGSELTAARRFSLRRGPVVRRHAGPPRHAVLMELIGDNYVHCAQGRHGDRGTFEYYLQQITVGMFPWTGPLRRRCCGSGGFCAAHGETSSRRELTPLCVAWFVIDFGVVTLVNTKFHHYILPALPPLAIRGAVC